MIDQDAMMGIKKPDQKALKEVKVKLPVQHLLKLHYLKLTSGTTFSKVIAEALTDYFDALDNPVVSDDDLSETE